jgi:hypothetical protein
MDLIGRVFNDPDIGLYRVVEVGPPHRLAPGKGNLDPIGPQLQAGWVPTLRYTSLGGVTHTYSVTEVAEWVRTLAPPDTSEPWLRRVHHNAANNPAPPHPHLYYLPQLIHHPDTFSAFTTPPPQPLPSSLPLFRFGPHHHPPPVYSPVPADLNLDGAGQPLSFFSAIRGSHGKEWTLADERELIELLVTLKCLLAVMPPGKTPTYLKRVVKEKWDEVNKQRNRRMRWTIGGARIDIDYEVGTNTAAFPAVNALFHSIFTTNSFMATIDIVDYYLGAILPSPEYVRIDVSSISLPTLTKLGLLPFLRHSHGKPFLFCDVLKTVPGLPRSGLLFKLRLVSLFTQHG